MLKLAWNKNMHTSDKQGINKLGPYLVVQTIIHTHTHIYIHILYIYIHK